jgi:hypothetical protein
MPGPVPPASPLPPLDTPTIVDGRAQRRAERAARRAARAPGSGGLIVGVVLVLVGLWFLARQVIPELDPGRYWPFAIIVLGIVLLLFALTRRGGDGPGSPR